MRSAAVLAVALFLLPAALAQFDASAVSSADLNDLEESASWFGVKDEAADHNIVVDGHGTGFAPPSEEAYERLFSSSTALMALPAAAPASVDLSDDPWFPAVGDQKSQGSCAAWALAYYCYGYQEAKDNNWIDAGTNPEHQISPAWGYNRVSGGHDRGSWMGDVADVLCDWGAATMATMPYDPADCWSWGSEDAFREAPLHRAYEARYIAYEGDGTIVRLKELIASGVPVTFSMDSSNIQTFRDNFILSSQEYSYNALENPDHAQTLVGYDDSVTEGREFGAFKVVNSWGTDFGDDGFYWLTYDAIKEIGAANRLHPTYVLDREDYEPSTLMVWHFDVAPLQNAIIKVSAGTAISPRYNSADNVLMPPFMLLDVTDLEAYLGQPFQLSVGGPCTISSLRMEHYDGYMPGRPSRVSGMSPNVPATCSSAARPATASVTLAPYEAVPLDVAMDRPGAFLATGGKAAWSAASIGSAVGATAAQSGDIASGTSWMSMSVFGPGLMTFNWRIDAMGYADTLSLTIDGVVSESISGTTSWSSNSIMVPAGNHEVCWAYQRSGAGGGSGLVDALSWRDFFLRINNDEELRDMAERFEWSGSGTASSPFQITDLSLAMSGSGPVYIGNTTLHVRLADNALGGAEGAALHLFNATNVQVGGNAFTGNGIGILVERSSKVAIEGNEFTGNGIGIDIDGSGTVAGNIFDRNGGHAVVARSSGWSIYLNAFFRNNGIAGSNDGARSQASDLGGSFWSKDGQGNHWSDWTVDMNGDGFSDSEYGLGNAVDAYPCAAPASAPTSFSCEISGSTAVLDWGRPEHAVIEVIGYEVERSGPGGVTYFIVASGQSALTDSGLSESATYEYRVRAVCKLGNGSWSAPIEVFIPDATPPELSITSPSKGAWTGSSTAKVAWAGEDRGSGIDRYEVSLDSGAFEDVGPATERTFTGLSGGTHVVAVRAYDAAGNKAEASSSFNIDLTRPTINVVSPAPGVLGSSMVDISIKVSDIGSGGLSTTVRLNGVTYGPYKGTGGISFPVGLDDGTYELRVTARDAVGNSALSTVKFTVAAAAPDIQIIAPSAGTLSSASINVTCSFDGPEETWAEVRIDGGEWHNISAAPHHVFTGLDDGAHLIEARAWDASGRTAERSVSVTIDTKPPAVTMEQVNGTIRLTFSEDVDRDTATCSLDVDHSVVWDHGVMVIIPAVPMAEGIEHSISVHAEDAAGNAVDRSFSFIVQTSEAVPPQDDAPLMFAAVAVIAVIAAALVLIRRK